MYCAAVPNGRCHWPFQIQTRSPTRAPGTPAPTASMTPAPSLCGMTGPGSGALVVMPLRLFQSDGLTPDVASLTRTSPGPGSGFGNSPIVSTSRAGPRRV